MTVEVLFLLFFPEKGPHLNSVEIEVAKGLQEFES